MRISAETHCPPHDWFVWHCEECRVIPMVRWADDAMNALGLVSLMGLAGSGSISIACFRKVLINVDRRTVLVNPVKDNEDVKPERELVTIER